MSIKDVIASAGRNLNTVVITTRLDAEHPQSFEAEPYSYRVADGIENLFCFDITQGSTRNIEVHSITVVEETNNAFTPRWPVEVKTPTTLAKRSNAAALQVPSAGTERLFNEDLSFLRKPQAVVTATNLFWFSLAISLVKLLSPSTFNAEVPVAFTIFVLIITYAVMIFLILKISAGRNWARVTYAVLFLIGLLPTLIIILSDFSKSAFIGCLSTAQVALQGYALFLLFTPPGSSWFQQSA